MYKRKASDYPKYIGPETRGGPPPTPSRDRAFHDPEVVNEITDFLNVMNLNKNNEKCTPTTRVYKTLNPEKMPCPDEADAQEGRCCVSRTVGNTSAAQTSSEKFIDVVSNAMWLAQDQDRIPPRYKDLIEHARNRSQPTGTTSVDIDYDDRWALDALRFICITHSTVDVVSNEDGGVEKYETDWHCREANRNYDAFIELVNRYSTRTWHTWGFGIDVRQKKGEPDGEPKSVFHVPILPARSLMLHDSTYTRGPLYELTYVSLKSLRTAVLDPKFVFDANTYVRLVNCFPSASITEGNIVVQIGELMHAVADKLIRCKKDASFKFECAMYDPEGPSNETPNQMSTRMGLTLDKMRTGFNIEHRYNGTIPVTWLDGFTLTLNAGDKMWQRKVYVTTETRIMYMQERLFCTMTL